MLGEAIRAARLAAGMTQRDLGERTGIVGKYVSEIERGTRDVPLSTLHAIVELGLARRLAITFAERDGDSPIPADVQHLAVVISQLPDAARNKVVRLVHALVELVR